MTAMAAETEDVGFIRGADVPRLHAELERDVRQVIQAELNGLVDDTVEPGDEEAWRDEQFGPELAAAQRRTNQFMRAPVQRRDRIRVNMRHEAASKRAKAQPRDERGRFIKREVNYRAHYLGGNRVVAAEGGVVSTVPVPGNAVTRTWTGGNTVQRPIIYTEVAGHNDEWNRIGGWTQTGGWTQIYDVNRSYTTATTQVTYATPDRIWGNWIQAGTGGVNFTTTANVTINATQAYNQQVWQRWEFQHDETLKERAEREIREREARDRLQATREAASRRRLADAQRLEAAEERARELLEMILSDEERLYLENTGDIRILGSSGGLYVVQTKYYDGSVHGNVYKTDEHGCNLGRICVAPGMTEIHEGRRVALPLSDGFVGQVLAIRFNEEEFVRKGNWSYQNRCQQQGVTAIQRDAAA